MKPSSFLKMAMAAIALTLASCGSHKAVVSEPRPQLDTVSANLIKKVDDHMQSKVQTVSSKLKFSITVGDQHISLTGNLHMRRDDVIRMQLMAFGFVEAARLEFTQDYVLIMDRINKQYIKAPYYYIDFLRNSGINFNTLQALFWNELFQPGKDKLTDDDRALFTMVDVGETETLVNFDTDDDMFYSWLVSKETGLISMANIQYRNERKGNTQLNWDYRGFTELSAKPFPCDWLVTLTLPSKEVQMGVKLNYLNTDEGWEARTRVSDKYREVQFDEILRRFMAL